MGVLSNKADDVWTAEHCPKPASVRTKGAVKKDDLTMKSDVDFWKQGLAAQAQKSEVGEAQLLLNLLGELAHVPPRGDAGQKFLAKQGPILPSLLHTGVVVQKKGGLQAGESWGSWTGFLFGEHRRHGESKPKTPAPGLRKVA